MLPEGVPPTKDEILKVLRSSFFRSGNEQLSHTINTSPVGLIMARSFGFEYNGEGLEAFLNGLRETAKRDKAKKQKKIE